MSAQTTPLGAMLRGLAAGAAGTVAMTAAQTAVARKRGQEASTTPATVARRVIEGVLDRDVPDDDATTEKLNNAMHWSYGTGWGAVYGLARGTREVRVTYGGPAFGVVVWGASLVELPAMKLAPPVWEYPPLELALEVGYHVIYGLGVATAYAVLDR